MRTRHTMGQDWGGRHASNPPGAPKVTRQQVLDAAKAAGVEVRRGVIGGTVESPRFIPTAGWSSWFVLKPGDEWRTLADTNYHALCALSFMRCAR